MQKQEILKSYPEPEDKLLVSKLLDKINDRDLRNKIVTTEFLNMHEKSICEEILKKEKIPDYIFTGGFEDAERTILILYPYKLGEEYIKTQLESWLSVIRIVLPKYNEEYTHREYLGGIMKLGIKREKIGDIIVLKDGADIIVASDIADFLKQELANLTRFSKSKIEIKSIYELRNVASKKEEETIIVPSYRIDVIVGEALRTSRSKASNLIDEERVFINGQTCKNGAKPAKIGDKITVRGKGRFEIKEELGATKKDNLRIKIVKYVWKRCVSK